MGGFGSISAMNSTLKENKKLRKEKLTFRDRKFSLDDAIERDALIFKQMNAQELKTFSIKQKQEKVLTWVKISFVGVVILVLTGIFIVWINSL